MKPNEELDESFLPFGELLEEMSNVEGMVGGQKMGMVMQMEEATLGLPIQLEVLVDDEGQVQIGGTPPQHYTETSFDPIYHQLKITIIQEVSNQTASLSEISNEVSDSEAI